VVCSYLLLVTEIFQNHRPVMRAKSAYITHFVQFYGIFIIKVCVQAKWPIRPELIPVSVA